MVITFHEGEVTEDTSKMHEFIFLFREGKPKLQPWMDLDVAGALTPAEIQAAIDRMGESVTGQQKACVEQEVLTRAAAAGEPEILDPDALFRCASQFSKGPDGR